MLKPLKRSIGVGAWAGGACTEAGWATGFKLRPANKGFEEAGLLTLKPPKRSLPAEPVDVLSEDYYGGAIPCRKNGGGL